jgi:hypothetical protein
MKLFAWFVAAVIFTVGFWFGHVYHARQRYDLAWEAGNKNGFDSGADAVEKEWVQYGKDHSAQHHYEFKQNGASIYRLDSDTGEACWIQLSVADHNSPMTRCPQ